jgi:hypothetical protein
MIGFPLLLIPLAIVNIAVFLMGLQLDRLQERIVSVDLPSLQSWAITYSDVLLAFGLFLLFLEVVKSARPGSKYFTDHLLSFVVFAAAAAEFLLLPPFAHSTFFLLVMMAFTDVIAGITIRYVRPKPVVARAAPAVVEERPVSKPAPPPQQPSVAPAPPQPSAASAFDDPPPERSATPERSGPSEHRDAPIAPNQEILPPEPTIPPRR